MPQQLRCGLIASLALLLPGGAFGQFNTHLSPKTEQSFEDYRKSAEASFDWRAHGAPPKKPGDVTITATGAKGTIDVPDGLLHDWIAATVIPGTTVEKTIALLQNYNEYKNAYKVDVADSKLLRRDGEVYHAYLQLVKKKILTVVLNSEFEIEYRPLDQGRWAILSHSTRIAELDGKKELAPGEGHGFLWHLNAYWLVEPRPEGVYLECRSISLSRDIPAGLGWIIKPFVTSVPKDSLKDTLEATIKALR